jgi:hypothetical protein
MPKSLRSAAGRLTRLVVESSDGSEARPPACEVYGPRPDRKLNVGRTFSPQTAHDFVVRHSASACVSVRRRTSRCVNVRHAPWLIDRYNRNPA